jgi:hypothetical protein
VTAADWIVIPRALSAGRKSVTVDPSSTSREQKIQEKGSHEWETSTLPPILRV